MNSRVKAILLALIALTLAGCSPKEAAQPTNASLEGGLPPLTGKPQFIEFYADW